MTAFSVPAGMRCKLMTHALIRPAGTFSRWEKELHGAP
jgi:hypothetical protein